MFLKVLCIYCKSGFNFLSKGVGTQIIITSSFFIIEKSFDGIKSFEIFLNIF